MPSTLETEATLRDHPLIRDCAVIGIRDDIGAEPFPSHYNEYRDCPLSLMQNAVTSPLPEE